MSTNSAISSLLLGASGTGKSYFCKSISKSSSVQVYVINAKENDFPSEHYEHILYSDLEDDFEEYKNSIIIWDDLVRPSDAESKLIYQILVKYKRFYNINFFCIAHSVQRNNLHSLVQHFDNVMFTNSEKNLPVFKIYAKKFCPKDDQESLSRWYDFTKQAATNYLRYDNVKSIWETVDSKGNVLSSPESKLRKEIISFIQPFGQVNESMSLYDYLIKVLPANSITESDHILTLKNAQQEEIGVNILDVIYWVPRKNLDRPPPSEIITAFRSLQKLFKIPYCFIGNQYF